MNNQVKVFGFLTILTVLLVGLGSYFGGPGGGLFFLIIVGALNFGTYFYSDKIALKMNGARLVERGELEWLRLLLEDLASKAEIPTPKLYVIDKDIPNAFATGRNPEHGAVAVTSGLLRILNRDEVEGVVAHEVSHIKHRDTLLMVIVATLAGAIVWVADSLRWSLFLFGGGDDEGGNPLVLLLTTLVAGIAAMMLQAAISREREYYADAGAAHLTQNPKALANALEQVQQYNQRGDLHANAAYSSLYIIQPLAGRGIGTAIARAFATHPPTEERIGRLLEIAKTGNVPV